MNEAKEIAGRTARSIAPARHQDCTEWIVQTFRPEWIIRELGPTVGNGDIIRAVGHMYALQVIDREYMKTRNY